MGGTVYAKNIAALIVPKMALAGITATAGGAGDNSTDTGASIDRESFAGVPKSCDVEVYYSAALASGATLSLAFSLEDSADGSSWSTYVSQSSAVVATGASGGSTEKGVARMKVQSTADNPTPGPGIDLSSARRYVRVKVTPDLSATGTDTAAIAAGMVFGGFDELPAA